MAESVPNVENPKFEDVDRINRILDGKKTKYRIVVVFFKTGPKRKRGGEKRDGDAVAKNGDFLVREYQASL